MRSRIGDGALKMEPGRPLRGRDDMLPAWRAACVAYRAVRRQGLLDEPAHRAALEAFLRMRPDVMPEEASKEVGTAICYASVEHPGWFWSGVGGR